MAKIIRMVAEILAENCTGCRLCTFVCPTAALTMRPRGENEEGPGRYIAELPKPELCLNAQNCLEICPDDAIVMNKLDQPFTVGVDPSTEDPEKIAELCLMAGQLPDARICFCTETTAAELAAAILQGADTPEELAIRTGGRTGCAEICQQPTLRLLAAAGHGDTDHNPPRAFQWYGLTGNLMENLDENLEVPQELLDEYPQYPLEKDRNVVLGNLKEA